MRSSPVDIPHPTSPGDEPDVLAESATDVDVDLAKPRRRAGLFESYMNMNPGKEVKNSTPLDALFPADPLPTSSPTPSPPRLLWTR